MSQANFAVHGLSGLREALAPKDIIVAVREALIAHSRGEVVSTQPGLMVFEDPPGDCHIKSGYFKGGPVFVIKVATGFYNNPSLALDTNSGLLLVFDATTGQTLALLDDQGWLTSWRTAAAGALAAQAGAPSQVSALGIVGSGHQAELQALWTCELLGIERVFIWGRSPEKARALAAKLCAQGLKADNAATVYELFERCNLVITCTPSRHPLVPADAVKTGTHIVALGADSPGKQELDPAILGRARVVMTDDRGQCGHHGELGHSLRAGFLKGDSDVSLGQVLAGTVPGRLSDQDITVADLTGLAAQDVAIATLAVEKLHSRAGLVLGNATAHPETQR